MINFVFRPVLQFVKIWQFQPTKFLFSKGRIFNEANSEKFKQIFDSSDIQAEQNNKEPKRAKERLRKSAVKDVSRIQSNQNRPLKNISPIEKRNKNLQNVENRIIKKRQQNEAVYSNEQQEKVLQKISQLKQNTDPKELSVFTHKMLLSNQKSSLIWSAIQEAFLHQLQLSTQQVPSQQTIRSYGKMLYCLSKSRQAKNNYETHMALIMAQPGCSHQSFTQMATSISRMGGMSQQFGYILEKLYYKRKKEFNPREIIQLNYVLSRNGRSADPQMIGHLDSLNLKEIVLMLRSYDTSGLLGEFKEWKKCRGAIISRRAEMNVLDLSHLMNLYTKHRQIDEPKMLALFEEQYQLLAKNINEEAFETIWEFVPQALNENKLSVKLTEAIIKTMGILRKKELFSDKVWNSVKGSFPSIENLEVKVKLERL